MCEYLGYNVTKLQRTRIMHIYLDNLKIGQYRNLNPEESETLYKKIANSVKTEEASAKKGKPAGKSSTAPKNSTVAKSQQAKSSPAKKERSALGSNFKSAKPAAGRKTSYNPKSKTQRRSR